MLKAAVQKRIAADDWHQRADRLMEDVVDFMKKMGGEREPSSPHKEASKVKKIAAPPPVETIECERFGVITKSGCENKQRLAKTHNDHAQYGEPHRRPSPDLTCCLLCDHNPNETPTIYPWPPKSGTSITRQVSTMVKSSRTGVEKKPKKKRAPVKNRTNKAEREKAVKEIIEGRATIGEIAEKHLVKPFTVMQWIPAEEIAELHGGAVSTPAKGATHQQETEPAKEEHPEDAITCAWRVCALCNGSGKWKNKNCAQCGGNQRLLVVEGNML